MNMDTSTVHPDCGSSGSIYTNYLLLLFTPLFQLSSLYDVKPPISKGKMTAITKAALKGVKLYKHVVQSVEKFIQKVIRIRQV
jgi:hypothetical protein